MMEKYVERLQLDDAQVAELEIITERRSKSFREIFSSVRPKMMELREASRKEIRTFLKPEQMSEFEKLCQEEDERFRSWQRKSKPETEKSENANPPK